MKTIAAKDGYWFTSAKPTKLRFFFKEIKVADNEDYTQRFVEWSDEQRKEYLKKTLKISV